jgi:HEAT repeat protein
VRRLLPLVAAAALLIGGAAWYYQSGRGSPLGADEAGEVDDQWLEDLYSQNPSEAAAAAKHVEELGEDAVPIIEATLQDSGADRERRKAALKAVTILGPIATPLIPLVTAELTEPDLTAEAAVALSFMGRQAFAPLRDALSSDDPVVRREALRSIGKLKDRAPLDARAVVPLLVRSMSDPDPGVRTVAATYLGIVHEGGAEPVKALIEALKDPAVEVRRAAATALGEFGADAAPAIPALRKSSTDPDEEVARESGRALVKLQGK